MSDDDVRRYFALPERARALLADADAERVSTTGCVSTERLSTGGPAPAASVLPIPPLNVPAFAIEVVAVRDRHDRLHADEHAAIATAGPSRRATFSSGRYAARRALDRLGAPPVAIGRSASGAPCWPADVRGSISHTRDLAIAAVERIGAAGREPDTCRAIGVDIERIARAEAGLLRRIATDRERDWIDRMALADDVPAILFACKEAFYKCLSPTVDRRIGFGDVSFAPFGPVPPGVTAADGRPLRLAPTIERVADALAALPPPAIRVLVFREHVIALARI